MSESDQQMTEEVGGVIRTTRACDLCCARKVKCDRNVPCSACVTSKVSCYTTKRSPTRKKKHNSTLKVYEQHIGNVNRKLEDLSTIVQNLAHSQQRGKSNDNDNRGSTKSARSTPHASVPNSLAPDTEGDAMVYEGDTSFNAHSRHITNALGEALSTPQDSRSPAVDQGWIQKMLQEDGTGQPLREAASAQSSSPAHQVPGSSSLPPMPLVLRLLRAAKSSTQSWFVASQVVSLSSFTDLCQNVYFPTKDYTIFTWITVNVGLFYLLRDCDTALSENGRLDKENLDENRQLCKRNVDNAIHSLPLGCNASVEACQALMLGASLAIEDGKIPFAWRLTSIASRMCLDLGLHRLPHDTSGPEGRTKRVMFWNIFSLDKGLAFNFGMTPTIRDYDITTNLPSVPGDLDGHCGVYFLANIEFAMLQDEIYEQLFSASAAKKSQNMKAEAARAFASRIHDLRSKVMEAQKDTEHESSLLVQCTALATEIMMLCLLTIVYRVMPPTKQPAHPLQVCDECIESARTAMATLFQVCAIINEEPESWPIFINWTLLSMPFVPFIVLFGSAIAQKNHEDLKLLQNTLTILASAADHASAVRKLHLACSKLTQLAEILVAGNFGVNEHNVALNVQADDSQHVDFQAWQSFPEIDQHWAGMLNEMDFGLVDEGAMGMPSYFAPMMNGGGNLF